MKKTHSLKPIAKLYFTLSLLTFFVFMLIGTGSLIQSHLSSSPHQSMKGLAGSVPSRFFVDMIAMEVPQLQTKEVQSAFSLTPMFQFVFRYLTDINPNDPKSLIAMEVPGIGGDETILLRTASNTGKQLPTPQHYTPPQSALQPAETSPDAPTDEKTNEMPSEQTEAPETDQAETPDPPADPKDVAAVETTGDTIKAFIYHSHNRESWLPELGKAGHDFSEAFDDQINVTLLGKRMAQRLEEKGIGAISSETDYPTEITDYNWNFSYKYSMETVKEAMATYSDLEYYFDIHRDAQGRKKTTVEIDGENYAQAFFIIGHRNPNWKKNEAFAAQIHEVLEAEYPGLSRGIWGKNSQSGHGEYNQSVSPNSILIEVGGPENTLEESYRTIDVLANIIADLFWDAKRVDAPVTVGEQKEQAS